MAIIEDIFGPQIGDPAPADPLLQAAVHAKADAINAANNAAAVRAVAIQKGKNQNQPQPKNNGKNGKGVKGPRRRSTGPKGTYLFSSYI